MKHPSKNSGLTLVEIIVAIAVFSIIMLALSGTIVQGLQLRRQNGVDSQALAYATSILETYKNFWSTSANFGKNTTPVLPPTPPSLKDIEPLTDISLACFKADGSPSSVPDCALRRVQVRIYASKNTTTPLASLVTEVGNPER
jgi:prepilin-type N-terminal cleavage/methylation domain-containing protein